MSVLRPLEDRLEEAWALRAEVRLVQFARHVPPAGWAERAECLGLDPALFFPEGSGADLNPARDVCRRCPVRLSCLRTNLGELHGCWAGLSEKQRQRVRAGLRDLSIVLEPLGASKAGIDYRGSTTSQGVYDRVAS